MDFGDIPTWFGSLATAWAALWAVWLYRGSLRERATEQARLVSGWQPGGPTLIPEGQQIPNTPFIAEWPTLTFAMSIRNRSDELISDVRADIVHANGDDVHPQAGAAWTDVGPGQDIDITYVPCDPSSRGWTVSSAARVH